MLKRSILAVVVIVWPVCSVAGDQIAEYDRQVAKFWEQSEEADRQLEDADLLMEKQRLQLERNPT